MLLCGLICIVGSIGSAFASNTQEISYQEVMVQARELQTAGEVKQAYQLMQVHADENAGIFVFLYLR